MPTEGAFSWIYGARSRSTPATWFPSDPQLGEAQLLRLFWRYA